MNVIMAHIRGDVSYVAVLESVMPTIARSVPFRRRIGTAVQRLSIWALPRLTSSTNARNTASKRGNRLKGSLVVNQTDETITETIIDYLSN